METKKEALDFILRKKEWYRYVFLDWTSRKEMTKNFSKNQSIKMLPQISKFINLLKEAGWIREENRPGWTIRNNKKYRLRRIHQIKATLDPFFYYAFLHGIKFTNYEKLWIKFVAEIPPFKKIIKKEKDIFKAVIKILQEIASVGVDIPIILLDDNERRYVEEIINMHDSRIKKASSTNYNFYFFQNTKLKLNKDKDIEKILENFKKLTKRIYHSLDKRIKLEIKFNSDSGLNYYTLSILLLKRLGNKVLFLKILDLYCDMFKGVIRGNEKERIKEGCGPVKIRSYNEKITFYFGQSEKDIDGKEISNIMFFPDLTTANWIITHKDSQNKSIVEWEEKAIEKMINEKKVPKVLRDKLLNQS